MAESNTLQERLTSIRDEVREKLQAIMDSRSVYEYRKSVFDGKTGLIGSLMREMGKIPK